MIRLLALVLIALPAFGQFEIRRVPKTAAGGGGGGTPAWVQDATPASYDPYGASRTITLNSVVAGNMVVAIYSGGNLPITCTASGHTFSTLATTYFGVCVAYNSPGGNVTITVAPSSSFGNPAQLLAMEVENIATSSAFDQECGADGFVANQNCTTGTLAQASEFVIGIVATSASVTAGSGYTLRAAIGTLKTQTKAVSATTAVNVGFTHAESTATVQGVTFKGN